MTYTPTQVNQIRTGDVVVINGQPQRVTYAALVRGVSVQLKVVPTRHRAPVETTHEFGKFTAILKAE